MCFKERALLRWRSGMMYFDMCSGFPCGGEYLLVDC